MSNDERITIKELKKELANIVIMMARIAELNQKTATMILDLKQRLETK